MSKFSSDKANDVGSSGCEGKARGKSGGTCSCCASSTFSCVKDLGHKQVTLYTSATNILKQPQQQQVQAGGVQAAAAAGGGGRGRKKCLWFSRDYGQPIFAMHSNCYLNSECFIIDPEISILTILPTYKLILFKEHIHVLEEDDTKFSLEFRDGSDSFAVWIQICAVQNAEPFSTTSVQLTRISNMVPLEKHLLHSSAGPTPASSSSSSWLTMKFKATSISENKSSNWFTFANMQILGITFKKWRHVVLLLKSDDPDDDDSTAGLFCIRPGVTCLKTASQLYYEPCDATSKKYILDFDNQGLCDHIWNFIRLVTPRDFAFANANEHLKTAADVDSMSEKLKRMHSILEAKRARRLKMIYSCFDQLRQEVEQIMTLSKSKIQEIIDMPEIHITNLFFSTPVWIKRCENVENKKSSFEKRSADRKDKFKREVRTSLLLQYSNAKLHMDIVKMLIKQHVPAELISEYRESLARRMNGRRKCDRDNNADNNNNTVHCPHIHCLFT